MDLVRNSPTSSSARTVTPMNIVPATDLPAGVHLGLTVFFTVLYTMLFVTIFIQMFRLLYYQHKLFSYQSVFLFLCLVWAALRIDLFTFYYQNVKLANSLPRGWYFILYALPVCLQYVTLSLLVLYFCRVWLKAKERAEDPRVRQRYQKARTLLYVVWVFLILLMFAANLISSLEYTKEKPDTQIIHFRVAITEGLFLLNAFALGGFVMTIYKTTSANAVLETQGTTVARSTVLSGLLVILFLSRAIYNIVITSPAFAKNSYAYTWLNASDEAEDGGDEGRHYVAFGIVLFIWEILPTFFVIFFFRMRRPEVPMNTSSASPRDTLSEPCFFDNPNRYESDGEDSHTPLLRGGHRHIHPTLPSLNHQPYTPRQSSLPSPAYPTTYGHTPPPGPVPTVPHLTAPGRNPSHFYFGQ